MKRAGHRRGTVVTRATTFICFWLALACRTDSGPTERDCRKTLRTAPADGWHGEDEAVRACVDLAIWRGSEDLLHDFVQRMAKDPRELSPSDHDRLVQRLLAVRSPNDRGLRWLRSVGELDALAAIAARSGMRIREMQGYCSGEPPFDSDLGPDTVPCLAYWELDDACTTSWAPACGLRSPERVCPTSSE